ncbi:MAG: ATP synthase subunit I [Gammaproteobacteria bacterium]|nr:ATP synthase subunit I [Gammaproteobacteria bacterium]
MVSVGLPEARRLAISVVAGQATVTVIAAIVCRLVAGPHAALSALLGGGIGTLASLVMVVLGFGRRASSDAHLIVRGFYLGEAVKLGLTVALFVLVLRTMKVSVGPLFGAYVATFFVYWLALGNVLPPLGGGPGVRGR